VFTLAPVFVIGPAIAKESLGGSSAWAVILTGEAVGALLGSVAAIRWRPHRTLVVMGAILGLACLQPAFLAAQAAVLLIAFAGALTGFGFAFGNVLYETMVQERVRPEHLSRVSAYGWFSAMCCLPLGYALAGPAAEVVGMDAVLWFGAGWMALSSIVFIALPPIRGLRRGEERASRAAPEPAAA
jgi:MFS family permease